MLACYPTKGVCSTFPSSISRYPIDRPQASFTKAPNGHPSALSSERDYKVHTTILLSHRGYTVVDRISVCSATRRASHGLTHFHTGVRPAPCSTPPSRQSHRLPNPADSWTTARSRSKRVPHPQTSISSALPTSHRVAPVLGPRRLATAPPPPHHSPSKPLDYLPEREEGVKRTMVLLVQEGNGFLGHSHVAQHVLDLEDESGGAGYNYLPGAQHRKQTAGTQESREHDTLS